MAVTKMPSLIHWMDITSYTGWNDERVEAGEDNCMEFTTVGFVIKNDTDKLVISDTYPEIGTVTIFPAGCVISVTDLEIETGEE
jgi:hypothetical protein